MKKEKIKRNIDLPVAGGLFFAIAFVYFCLPGNYVLYFQETQTLFLFTGEYLHKYLIKPGGLLEFTARFLEQFYAVRFTGALIIAIVLTLPLVLLYRINKRLIPGNAFSLPLLLVPSLLMLVMQANYYHLIEYNLGYIVILGSYLLMLKLKESYKHYVILITFPLLYYLAGAYAMIFMIMYVIHNLFFEVESQRFIPSLALIVTAGVSFILFWRVIFLQTIEQIILAPLPLLESPFYRVLFIILTGYIAFYPLIIRRSGRIRMIGPNRRVYPVALAILISGVAIYTVIRIHNPQTQRVVEIERLVFSGRFDEAVSLHERKPSRNLIGQYFYNYALSETGQLCERMFAGRQDFSAGSLVLPWGGEHLNRGGYFYYSVGLINEAHRWAYEEMVVYGIRPQNMQMLARTSILNGDYRMARKYLSILKKTLFYRNWAREYENLADNPELISSHHDLGRRLKLVPENNFFIQFNEPQNNIPYLLEGNPLNRQAIEYYLAGLLLTKKVEIIVNNIGNMEDSGYTTIPRHIEEAILIYYNSTRVFPDLGKLRMNLETPARFDRYQSVYLAARQNQATLEERMEQEFGDTFWFYFHFR